MPATASNAKGEAAGSAAPSTPVVTKENAEAGARLLRLVKSGLPETPEPSSNTGCKAPVVEALFNQVQEQENRKGSGKGSTRSRIRAHATAARGSSDQATGLKQILLLDPSISQSSARPSEVGHGDDSTDKGRRRRKAAPGRQGARGM
mmetsp:Transcript_31887/g.67822  ORF Transcript_31887/g.67822 Transcript_31887/m.67822 type:complete len:148 (-) Transcript_31887:226-669(-)